LQRVRLAVIGSTGMIGRVHVDAITRLENASLTAVAAINPAPLQEQARQLHVRAYTDLDSLLRDPDVDAVVVATPHPSHMSVVLKAARAGKHVLTDKPIAVAVSEAEQMVQAARSAGVVLGVIYQNRHRPESQKAREVVSQGLLGKIYRTSMVHATARTEAYYHSRPWRGTWSGEGGGVLLNQGIHSLDLLQWLGGMPRAVQGVASAFRHNIEVEDFATALLEYDGGGQGTAHCSTVQAPNDVRLELYGDLGSLAMADGSLTWHKLATPMDEFMASTDASTRARLPHQTEVLEFPRAATPVLPSIQDFADALIHGREPAVSGEEAIKSLELCNAILLAAHTGRRISLPLDRQEYDAFMRDIRARHAP